MKVTHDGVTRTHAEWARLCGVSEAAMRWRLHQWGVARAVTTTGSRATGKRGSYRKRGMTGEQCSLIIKLYREGVAEDAIAEQVGKCRKTVSSFLIRCGVKEKGSAPKRKI